MTQALDGFEFRFLDFKGLSGQSEEWLSFDRTTLVVGRNNVGKSALVHALTYAVDQKQPFNPEWHRHGQNARYHLRQKLGERELQQAFPANVSGGEIGGNHWEFGKTLVGTTVEREFDAQRGQKWLVGPNLGRLSPQAHANIEREVINRTPFPNIRVFGVSAERNVVPEPAAAPAPVTSDGAGLTNLIRAFLYDSSLSMEEIEIGLLNDLNWVFENDTTFSRILCRQDQGVNWEIFLATSQGGAIRLSESGSSLKSIFIILAIIRLNALIDRDAQINNCVFYVEEPENNLHPALLRRLLEYLDSVAADRGCNLLITTHSPTAIDWASRRGNTLLYHVRRGDDGAIVSPVHEYGATRRLLDDLDVRASEILQANGVIWVEGPTERIYLRKWIEIFSEGDLVEGQHYSIMFYGGRLLSHLSAAEPGGDRSFIDLLRMNRNLALVMDSDRRLLSSGKFRSNLNSTKLRIREEANAAGGLIWITDGREIENYISGRLLELASRGSAVPRKFDSITESLGVSDKVEFAEKIVGRTEDQDLAVLDLKDRISELCATIREWNRLR